MLTSPKAGNAKSRHCQIDGGRTEIEISYAKNSTFFPVDLGKIRYLPGWNQRQHMKSTLLFCVVRDPNPRHATTRTAHDVADDSLRPITRFSSGFSPFRRIHHSAQEQDTAGPHMANQEHERP